MTSPSINILLVEDSPDDAELILANLREAGINFEFDRVFDEPSLRRCLADGAWDLVLSDYSMPTFSGSDALRILRESGLDIPFILLSGYLGEEAAVEIMRAGANDFVPKKNLARLVPAVQRELREAHNRAERRMAQDAVVARERLLGAVTQSIGAGIVVIDAHGRCRLTNREGERLLGLASLEVFGRRVDEFLGQMKNLGSDNSLEQQIMEVLSGTRPGWHEDIVWQRADNTHIPLSWVVTPLEQNGRVTGAVITFRDISERQRREEALRASREQLRALSLHLETLQEAERSRIARELHDELGQMLLAIKLDAAWVHGHCQEAPEETNRKTRALLTLIDETIDAVRRIAADLRPAVLNDLGLVAAIEWLVERFQQRSGVVCTLQVSADDFTVPPEVATAAFRMVQESLTNVARHAQARHLHVAVAQDGAALCVVVDDDGVGFAAEGGTTRASFGLIGIRERAAALGGTLKTGASEHGGARLVLRVPLARGVA